MISEDICIFSFWFFLSGKMKFFSRPLDGSTSDYFYVIDDERAVFLRKQQEFVFGIRPGVGETLDFVIVVFITRRSSIYID